VTRFSADDPRSITNRWLAGDDVELTRHLGADLANNEPDFDVDDFTPMRASDAEAAVFLALICTIGLCIILTAAWQVWVHRAGAAQLMAVVLIPAYLWLVPRGKR
jgi:hypothetical protein